MKIIFKNINESHKVMVNKREIIKDISRQLFEIVKDLIEERNGEERNGEERNGEERNGEENFNDSVHEFTLKGDYETTNKRKMDFEFITKIFFKKNTLRDYKTQIYISGKYNAYTTKHIEILLYIDSKSNFSHLDIINEKIYEVVTHELSHYFDFYTDEQNSDKSDKIQLQNISSLLPQEEPRKIILNYFRETEIRAYSIDSYKSYYRGKYLQKNMTYEQYILNNGQRKRIGVFLFPLFFSRIIQYTRNRRKDFNYNYFTTLFIKEINHTFKIASNKIEQQYNYINSLLRTYRYDVSLPELLSTNYVWEFFEKILQTEIINNIPENNKFNIKFMNIIRILFFIHVLTILSELFNTFNPRATNINPNKIDLLDCIANIDASYRDHTLLDLDDINIKTHSSGSSAITGEFQELLNHITKLYFSDPYSEDELKELEAE